MLKKMAENSVAINTAAIFLKTGCVAIAEDRDKYFTLTSGKKSPVYVDCRRLISYPEERKKIIFYSVEYIKNSIDLDKIDFIAGGETAGIPYAAWIADLTDKAMIYIRKKPKSFGKTAQIEGDFFKEKSSPNVLLVEDMATDGGSKILFTEAIRKAGGKIEHVFCPFFYDIFPNSIKIFEDNKFTMHYLTNWQKIIEFIKQENLFNDIAIKTVEDFLQSPEIWQKKNQ